MNLSLCPCQVTQGDGGNGFLGRCRIRYENKGRVTEVIKIWSSDQRETEVTDTHQKSRLRIKYEKDHLL